MQPCIGGGGRGVRVVHGEEGGGGGEGAVGGPMNLQPMLDQLTRTLHELIDQLRPPGGGREGEGEGWSSEEEEER